jgi:hypothetical protein
MPSPWPRTSRHGLRSQEITASKEKNQKNHSQSHSLLDFGTSPAYHCNYDCELVIQLLPFGSSRVHGSRAAEMQEWILFR